MAVPRREAVHGGVRGPEEHVRGRVDHVPRPGVDDAPVAGDDDEPGLALALRHDALDGVHHALVELGRGLAQREHVPRALAHHAGAHALQVVRAQRLHRRAVARHVAEQLHLAQVVHDHRLEPVAARDLLARVERAPEGAGVDGGQGFGGEALAREPRLLAPQLAEGRVEGVARARVRGVGDGLLPVPHERQFERPLDARQVGPVERRGGRLPVAHGREHTARP